MHTNTMRIKETDDIENVFRNFCRKLNDVILGECRMPAGHETHRRVRDEGE